MKGSFVPSQTPVVVGDYVQFNGNIPLGGTGSIGKIVAEHNDVLYVEWIYGLDCAGELMKSTSGFCRKSGGWEDNTLQLRKITEAEYQKVAIRKGFENDVSK